MKALHSSRRLLQYSHVWILRKKTVKKNGWKLCVKELAKNEESNKRT